MSSDMNFDEIVAINKEFAAQRGMTMYTRNVEEAKADLNDFQIKSVIGKGSFGKVFLVEKKDTKKVYAMKSLRKDVILDYDQIESTMLEKDIL
jgi:hypothetical protein